MPQGGYVVETSIGTWTSDHVVIATGGYDKPIEPAYVGALDPTIVQMHSVDYRNPSQLPEGDVLIVGTGQSGVQIMEDFVRAGRGVHLAVGPAPRSPRKYRGRDANDWLNTWGSGRFLGIEEDSAYLAEQIALQLQSAGKRAVA